MSKIIINRAAGYSNKLRKIKLILNNEEIGKIEDDEIKTIDLEPGKYKIKAEIDWCQSNEIEFNIVEDEIRKFNLRGTNPFLILYYITFGRNKYLKLDLEK